MEENKTGNIAETKKTSLGLDQNIAGALSYFLGFLTGILLLVTEKENKFVKFHAIQSIIISIVAIVVMSILGTILLFIPVIGWLIYALLNLGFLILWLLLMWKAFQGEKFKLPVIGDMAEKQVQN